MFEAGAVASGGIRGRSRPDLEVDLTPEDSCWPSIFDRTAGVRCGVLFRVAEVARKQRHVGTFRDYNAAVGVAHFAVDVAVGGFGDIAIEAISLDGIPGEKTYASVIDWLGGE